MSSGVEGGGRGHRTRGSGGTSVFRGAALTMVALIFTGVVRIASRIGAEKWFGIGALGMVTIAMAVAAIVTIVGPGGFAAGTTKFISQLRGEGRGERAVSMATVAARIGIAMTAAGAIVAVGYTMTNPTVVDNGGVWAVVATGVVTLTFGVYLVGKAVAYGLGEVTRYVKLEAIGVVLFGAVLASAVILDSSTLIIVALAVAYVPVGGIALRNLGRSVGSTGDLPMQKFFGYGVVGVAGSLAGIGFTYATPLAASYIDSLAGAALIGAALTVLEPLFLAPRAIGLVLLPHLSYTTAADEVAAGGASLRTSTGLVALVSSPAIAVVILERDRILQWVFSDEVTGGVNLALLAVAFFVSIVGAPSITALAAIRLRDATLAMWSSLAGFGVAIAIWIGLGGTLGLTAIGFGYLVGSIIQIAVPLGVATALYKPGWGSLWYRVGALAAVVALLATQSPSLTLDAVGVVACTLLLLPELRVLVTLSGRVVRG